MVRNCLHLAKTAVRTMCIEHRPVFLQGWSLEVYIRRVGWHLNEEPENPGPSLVIGYWRTQAQH